MPFDQFGNEAEWETCQRCGGDGEIVVCCDDICHGQGWCFHGDGMEACPDCKGEGEYLVNVSDKW